MVNKEEIQRWFDTLRPGAGIGIDEGGLQLLCPDEETYLEIGGVPESQGDQEREELLAKAHELEIDSEQLYSAVNMADDAIYSDDQLEHFGELALEDQIEDLLQNNVSPLLIYGLLERAAQL